MPPDKRPLFDVFGNQNHVEHIKIIDKFISSFLDSGEAMEIPLGDAGSDKNVGKIGTAGDPGVKRLVQSMSSEQKQELIANLLRHRSLHLGFLYGQLNHTMDENGQPINQQQQQNTTPSQSPELEQIIGMLSGI
jgi:hypothetical protein